MVFAKSAEATIKKASQNWQHQSHPIQTKHLEAFST
jgi:hypothetical protein